MLLNLVARPSWSTVIAAGIGAAVLAAGHWLLFTSYVLDRNGIPVSGRDADNFMRARASLDDQSRRHLDHVIEDHVRREGDV